MEIHQLQTIEFSYFADGCVLYCVTVLLNELHRMVGSTGAFPKDDNLAVILYHSRCIVEVMRVREREKKKLKQTLINHLLNSFVAPLTSKIVKRGGPEDAWVVFFFSCPVI